MKARTLLSICLLAGAAWAQTTPPSQKVVPEKKPAAVKPEAAKSAVKPAATPAAVKPAAKPVARKPAARKAVAAKPVRKAAVKPAAAPVESMAQRAPAASVGKRDPFVSPVRESGGPAGPNCTTGKKCLAIDAVDFKGTVRTVNGMIAVVESTTRRATYFLRENDPVFNGYVVKITPDSIVFRENVMDRLGRQSTRDITRRVSTPPV